MFSYLCFKDMQNIENNSKKVILFSIGSRGDMEPFLSIALLLKSRGYVVICSMPEQFRGMVEAIGLAFQGLSSRFLEAQESESFKLFVEGRGFFIKKMRNSIRIYKESKEIMVRILEQQHMLVLKENPDYVLYSAKCSYAVLWGMAHPGKTAMISPKPCFIHKVNEHPPIGVKFNLGKAFNRWLYNRVNSGIADYLFNETRLYHNNYPSVKASKKNIKNYLVEQEKFIYSFSPILFSRPVYWPRQAKVLGYRERQKTNVWKPSKDLLRFLDQHKKILFITFGSLVTNEPEKKTALFIRIVNELKIPVVVNCSWGGLVDSNKVHENIVFVNDIPYDWMFPKMYAIIHHGGAGTTHASLKYGCATMLIPHCFDQFFWNKIVSELNVGPAGIPVKKLNERNLKQKINDLWENENYKRNAELIACKMSEENFENEILEFIEK